MRRTYSGRSVSSRAAGGALLVIVLGLLTGCALPWVPAYTSSSSSIQSYPPPSPFVWTRVTPPPPTPQQAYAAGISQLRLCFNGPASATTTTWLAAGPTYGVALVRGECLSDPQNQRTGIAILPISLDKSVQPRCPAWVLEGGSVNSLVPADAMQGYKAYTIPPWLPLPNDFYRPEQLGGGVIPSSLLALESGTRVFLTGRYQGTATRPAGAETMSVGGHSGWRVSENGIVTVTVPLADGWTFFFGGTADATTMRQLASASLSHLDTLLPKPQPLSTDEPQPTPAC